ncbi:MAG: PSD1 domain-containing protein [Acidobacteria bacterium]|nr:PSD1 domain-containing protein [Acidobacteriota bacterium]
MRDWRTLWAAVLALPALGEVAGNEAIYRERLAPLLAAHCASCHTGAAPQGGLAMTGLAGLLTGGKHGPAIAPGSAAASLVVQYARGEKNPKMPLGGSLPDSVVAALAAAIDAMKPIPNAARDAHAEWLFSKVKAPAASKPSIDAFVRARLEAKGLSPAPPASRRALIRRVYFDLIGLPPPPEEVDRFLKDESPNAYEQLVDRLLADPRYGERWARHWLDLVRFAESDGFAIDSERPTAWRYRDYVIRAFNSDKPYDLFVKEQIAGDEVNDKRAGDDRAERLVALGFLRMGTWEADANFKTQLRQDFLNEITGTTGSVFLGLTIGCARCHDHKYDPIPQRDFYRLQAFFAATRIDDRPAGFTKSEDPAGAGKRLLRRLEDEAEEAAEQFKKLEEKLKQKYSEARNLKPGDKSAADYQKALKDKKDPVYTEEERRQWAESRDRSRRLGELPARHRPLAYAVSDVTPPHVPAVADTYVLAGGELANKGEKVEPGFLSCVTGDSGPAKIPFAGGSSGRRLALAEWIASADNPLTARVMVNRIWQHHFGEGLVRTPSDFGRNGERPSHPELLDWLAAQLVEKKWSLKALHKLMLTSNTYRQSSEHPLTKKYAEIDPNNQLLWRMNWLRLESEAVRDTILSISGQLEKSGGGPGVFLDVASDVAEGFEFFKWFPSPPKEQNRRTIYTFQRRSVVMPMMEVFDAANMAESCARRNVTTVAPQAFTLLNSDFTRRAARHFAERVTEMAGPDRDRRIDYAFRLALARSPSADEAARARGADLERLGVVLFNLNEFIYVE